MNKKLKQSLERIIEAASKPISWKQYGYLCGQAAARGDFYTRYKKNKQK